MPIYEHHCRDCNILWEEQYGINDIPPDHCPNCNSENVYRCIGSAGFVLKGANWAKDGYHKYGAYEDYKKSGMNLEVYDTKEDRARVMAGERKEAELKKLKRLNEVSKRTFGPDAAVTEKEASKQLQKAADSGRKEGLGERE